jgi:hypothetical protein
MEREDLCLTVSGGRGTEIGERWPETGAGFCGRRPTGPADVVADEGAGVLVGRSAAPLFTFGGAVCLLPTEAA